MKEDPSDLRKPGEAQPGRTQEPAAGEPAAGEPAAGEPAAGEPAAKEPAAGEPAAKEPAAGEPAAKEPAAGEPAAKEPAAGEDLSDLGTSQEVPAATAAELKSLARVGHFGFELYRQLKPKAGNLVFSPASLSVTLAMALGGAKGQTAEELARALGVGAETSERTHRLFGSGQRTWNRTKTVTLQMANRLFVESSMLLAPEYLALTRDHYQAPVARMDFKSSAETSRSVINRWVSGRTRNKIQNLLPPGSLDEMTRLVLTNAVYFQGTWLTQFRHEWTRPREFHSTDSESRKVPTMFMVSKLAWAQHPDGVRILETPYTNPDLTMIWLLPKKRHDLAGLEEKLSMAALDRWRKATRVVDVRVEIPKFRLEPPTLSLKPELQKMGIRHAFTLQADFSGMGRVREALFISDVYHQAFIEVKEEGTEAAAATAAVASMSAGSRPREEPATFIADQPFLFVLLDLRTQTPLFVGRVTHP